MSEYVCVRVLTHVHAYFLVRAYVCACICMCAHAYTESEAAKRNDDAQIPCIIVYVQV